MSVYEKTDRRIVKNLGCFKGVIEHTTKAAEYSAASLLSTFGGDEEDRTLDLTDANRTLSQLSYVPTT